MATAAGLPLDDGSSSYTMSAGGLWSLQTGGASDACSTASSLAVDCQQQQQPQLYVSRKQRRNRTTFTIAQVKNVKGGDSSLNRKPLTELRSVTCHMGSHSVTCHPTEVNAPRLNPSQTGRYSFYLPRRDGRLSWPWCWLYIKMVYLSANSHPSK